MATAGDKARELGAGAESFSRPVVDVDASASWTGVSLAELWSYRDLAAFLVWRDVRVRYKQTALGATWAVIQPLFAMLIFTLFFGRLAGIPSDGIPYPLFAYAGLLPWSFFSNAVTNAGESLVANSSLVTKVYFPRVIIPGAAVAAGLVDFAIAFCILVVIMALYRVAPGWGIALLPLLVLLTTMLAVAVGMWISAINVKYRDVRYALPFVIQVWMFATPIVYPASLVPERWRWLLALNPIAGIIDGYRSALFGRPFDWSLLSISAAVTVALLLYSFVSFTKMEQRFADIV